MTITHPFEKIIGRSKCWLSLLDKVTRAAKFNASVMIYGESGTGKEVIARAIHDNSNHKDKSFVPVDCVALPQNLLESELFGYEKGAFTGASTMRKGLIEYANEGTLFLDEICELDINLQAKLLRILQQREFRRVGGKEIIKVDVRIISASNQEPQKAVEERSLREDLFYRLNVIPLVVPPLRDRRDDIPLLLDHFLTRYCHHNRVPKAEISPDGLDLLMHHSWPGNVRELQNTVERLISLVDRPIIGPAEIRDCLTVLERVRPENRAPLNGSLDLPFLEAKKRGIEEIERGYFQQLLRKCDGNISRAAQVAQVSRPTVYRMIKTHDLFDLAQ